MGNLTPFFEQVQAHYDLSNEFFALFLDPSMTYSCAYFEGDDMSLEEAQMAKIDLALGKLGLRPGMRLLDIGCGWGATLRRAVERWSVRGIGLTLSRDQHRHVAAMLAELNNRNAGDDDRDGDRAPRAEVRLDGWEAFTEPVDRIVSIGAFEHFRIRRYPAFFERCRELLSPDGRLLLHTIVHMDSDTLAERGLGLTHEDVLFTKFIGKKVFPGGQLAPPAVITDHARRAGFDIARIHPLGPHYARTLDLWSANLAANRDRACALTSPQVYDMYQHYLTGCARYFRSGHIDVMQFTLTLS